MPNAPHIPGENRRSFAKKILATLIGAVTVLVPAAAGLMVFLDPLRRKSEGQNAVKIATLDALPNDGVPRKFRVLSQRTDAWNRFSQVPVGAVYLRRTQDGRLTALNVVCPHAGCFVAYARDKNGFHCPCHNSTFGADGKIADPKSPSPRAMDTLEVELREEREIWVKFQNFKTGHKEKIPEA
jgi:menaquinol-cytochrome c reductase iron-sulfur subunit